MKIGYGRVSTEQQSLDLQLDALKQVGCEKIYTDKVSGGRFDREGLSNALDQLRAGDTLVVWKLDRLGRSLKDLIEIVGNLKVKGIEFCSLCESIDTSTSAGKLIFHVFASLSEFEKNLIKERTMAGLNAARSRGRLGGRKRVLSKKQILIAKTLYDQNVQVSEICEQIKCSKATFYRHVVGHTST